MSATHMVPHLFTAAERALSTFPSNADSTALRYVHVHELVIDIDWLFSSRYWLLKREVAAPAGHNRKPSFLDSYSNCSHPALWAHEDFRKSLFQNPDYPPSSPTQLLSSGPPHLLDKTVCPK